MQKVAIQQKPHLGRFFGVKLCGEDVVAGNGGGVSAAVVGIAYAVGGVGGDGVVAV